MHQAGPSHRLRFDQFMETVLYDPTLGYYSTRADRAARTGDFVTSVELGDLLGATLERHLQEFWRLTGEQSLDVVEVGAGRGTLALSVVRNAAQSRFRDQLHFHLVERSAAAREFHAQLPREHAQSYASVDDLPPQFETGFLLAHELFDNLPVRRVLRSGGWKEIVLRLNGGRVEEEAVPADPDLLHEIRAHHVRLAEGQRAEVCPGASRLLGSVLQRFGTGGLLVFDYGDEAAFLYGDAHPGGTLATHRGHAASDALYEDLGERDLTADVNFTVLRETAEALGYSTRLTTQSRFLLDQGLPDLVAARMAATREELAKAQLAQWARVLYHPEGFGERMRVLSATRLHPPLVTAPNPPHI